jgi:hypothetical protein
MTLLIVPVIVGQGTRLFPDTGPDLALDLVESRVFPKGITLQVYRPDARNTQPTGAHLTQVTHYTTDRFQRGVAESLERHPGGGVGSGQRCS